MKKRLLVLVICITIMCLTGCAIGMPAEAVDGTPWSEDWTTLGLTLGIEQPGYGLTLRDNKAARKMFYATWSIGEAQPYTNSEGNETNIYDAQLVLLLRFSDEAESARANVNEWLDLAMNSYNIADTSQRTYNGQEFTVLTYTHETDTSPFAGGVSAFTVYDTCAIYAEFTYRDTFDGDPGEILADVLEHCHYAVQ